MKTILLAIPLLILLQTNSYEIVNIDIPKVEEKQIERQYIEQIFETTAYNTVPEQTDSTPCIAASGKNICGRNNVIACPRKYKFGTEFLIEEKSYICEDRLASRYDDRIDISFDKDIDSALQWGKRSITIRVMQD